MEIYFFIRLILFIFILSLLVILMLMISPLKHKKLFNGIMVGMFSALAVVVSGINVIITGYLGDGIYPGGDALISYLFLITLLLSVLNLIIYAKITK